MTAEDGIYQSDPELSVKISMGGTRRAIGYPAHAEYNLHGFRLQQ